MLGYRQGFFLGFRPAVFIKNFIGRVVSLLHLGLPGCPNQHELRHLHCTDNINKNFSKADAWVILCKCSIQGVPVNSSCVRVRMMQAPVTISKSSGVSRGKLICGVTVMTNGGPQSVNPGKLHGAGEKCSAGPGVSHLLCMLCRCGYRLETSARVDRLFGMIWRPI